MTTFLKDGSALLDYAFDWTAWLAASETIDTAVVTVPTGLVKNSQAVAGGKVTVWLSGGTVGAQYAVACRIVTNQGRTDERTFYVAVRDR